jgi:hypothetical protein
MQPRPALALSIALALALASTWLACASEPAPSSARKSPEVPRPIGAGANGSGAPQANGTGGTGSTGARGPGGGRAKQAQPDHGGPRDGSVPAPPPELDAATWGGLLVPAGAGEKSAWRAQGSGYVADGPGFRWRVEPEGAHMLSYVSIEDSGARVLPLAGSFVSPEEGRERIVDVEARGSELALELANGATVRVLARGGALAIELAGPGQVLRDIDLGGMRALSGVRATSVLQVPYADLGAVGVAVLKDGGVRYASAWFDLAVSSASNVTFEVPGTLGEEGELEFSERAYYLPDTADHVRPLAERVWVAWSEDLLDVLPAMARPPAPFRGAAGALYYLDYTCVPFADAAANLAVAEALGVDDLQVIMKQWQRDGYDRGYPDQVLPPRAEWGGLAGLVRVRETAERAGWGFGLHHNWCFNGTGIPDGSLLEGTGEAAARGTTSRFLKPSVARDLVDEVEGEIHAVVGTSGVYTDSITAVRPPVDLDGATPGAGLVQPTLEAWSGLLGRLRAIHGGPVCGEGGHGFSHVLWSGLADALHGTPGLATQEGEWGTLGAGAPVVPEFVLARLHPLSVRMGLGVPPLFFWPDREYEGKPYEPGQRDLVNGLSALYGAAGYHWWFNKTRPGDLARDWWATAAAARELASADHAPSSIRYADAAGREQTLSSALALGQRPRIGEARHHVTWSDGDQVWTNLRPEPWTIRPAVGADVTLPAFGRLVRAGEVEAGVVLEAGKLVEFSRSERHVFVDGRGQWVERDGLATDGAAAVAFLGPDEWRVHAIPEYRLAAEGEREELVRTRRVQLGARILGEGGGEYVLTYLGPGLEPRGRESVTLAAGMPLELDGGMLAARGALALHIAR